MIAFFDSIFNPFIDWLIMIKENLNNASVPVSQGFNATVLFAPIARLSPMWSTLITNVFLLAFIYLVIHVVINSVGLLETFKNIIKWW